jgi:hypothetical protein
MSTVYLFDFAYIHHTEQHKGKMAKNVREAYEITHLPVCPPLITFEPFNRFS